MDCDYARGFSQRGVVLYLKLSEMLWGSAVDDTKTTNWVRGSSLSLSLSLSLYTSLHIVRTIALTKLIRYTTHAWHVCKLD